VARVSLVDGTRRRVVVTPQLSCDAFDPATSRSEAPSTRRLASGDPPAKEVRNARRYPLPTTVTCHLSAEATGWVWRHSPFHASSLLVHLAIADVVNDANGNELWMTVEALAAKARVGRSSTVTALTSLVDGGFLEVTERGGGRGRATRYTFIMRPPENAKKQTVRDPAGSPPKPANKPRDMNVETVQSDAPIGITQGTQHNANDDSVSAIVDGRDADPSCVSCRGLGRVYNASGGFDAPCYCTWDPGYVRAPAAATRPPSGFGMPANRGGLDG
jgi:hypothetical protein